jgi:cytochrome c biogenesis protein CcdA
MSDGLLLAAATALWLGVLTSISPCPLATNIAAISFIARGMSSPGRVLATGVLYTLGRMLTYLILGALLVASLLSIPEVAMFLQIYMNKVLGPLLLVVGLILLDVIPLRFSTSCGGARVQKWAQSAGVWGSLPLGMVFALAFCPVSAALFFGSLIPLAVSTRSHIALPSLFGIGTGLPVFVFAVVIALSAQAVSRAYKKLTQVETWARRVTGAIFIAVGIYLSLIHIFGVLM